MAQPTKNPLSIETEEIKRAALVYRAVKHPLRQRMLQLMHQERRMNVTTMYQWLKLEQSVASMHLAILRGARLVVTEREGKEIYYSPDYPRLKEAQDLAKVLAG